MTDESANKQRNKFLTPAFYDGIALEYSCKRYFRHNHFGKYTY